MLRGKGRYRLKLELFLGVADRVADSEDSRVKHADDVTCVCLVDYLSLLCHDLLRLRKTHLFVALNVQNVHFLIELARAYAQEGDPVAVCLVHIRLNFEHECREGRVERVNNALR